MPTLPDFIAVVGVVRGGGSGGQESGCGNGGKSDRDTTKHGGFLSTMRSGQCADQTLTTAGRSGAQPRCGAPGPHLISRSSGTGRPGQGNCSRVRVSSVVRVAEPFGSGARDGVIGCAWARPPWREPIGAPGPEPSRRPPGSVGIRRLIEDPVQGGVAAFTSGLLRTQRHPARAMHPSFASRCVRALAGDHACGRRRPPVRA